MAYFTDDGYQEEQDELEKQKKLNLAGGSVGGGVVSTTPSLPTGGRGVAKPSGSTGFVNIQQYLKQNEGGGTKLAQQIAQGIDQKSANANEAVNYATKDFSNSANQSLPTFKGTDLGSKGPTYSKDITKGTFSATLPEGPSKEEIDRLTALSKSSYSGPSDIKTTGAYANASRAVDEALAAGSMLNSNEGVQQLAKGTRQGIYGSSALDGVLASESQGGKAALESSRKGLESVRGYLGGATEAANKTIATANKRASEIAGEANSELGRVENWNQHQKTLAEQSKNAFDVARLEWLEKHATNKRDNKKTAPDPTKALRYQYEDNPYFDTPGSGLSNRYPDYQGDAYDTWKKNNEP